MESNKLLRTTFSFLAYHFSRNKVSEELETTLTDQLTQLHKDLTAGEPQAVALMAEFVMSLTYSTEKMRTLARMEKDFDDLFAKLKHSQNKLTPHTRHKIKPLSRDTKAQ